MARNSQAHATVQISCTDGRLLENQLVVGLVFYNILKDTNWGAFPESVIMPQHSVGEVSQMFSQAYNQDFQNGGIDDDIANTESSESDDNVEVKLEHIGVNLIKDEYEHFVELTNQDNTDNVGILDDLELVKEMLDGDEMAIKLEPRTVLIKEFKYFCTLCEFVSKRNDHLKRHIERIHKEKDEDAPIYACESCSYISTIHENFKRHKKTLCNAKIEKCLFCDKRVLSKEAARVHRRRNHAEKWKQYKQTILKKDDRKTK